MGNTIEASDRTREALTTSEDLRPLPEARRVRLTPEQCRNIAIVELMLAAWWACEAQS